MWNLKWLRESQGTQSVEFQSLGRLGFGTHFRSQVNDDDDPDWVVARVASWDGVMGEVIAHRAYLTELSGKLRWEGNGPRGRAIGSAAASKENEWLFNGS